MFRCTIDAKWLKFRLFRYLSIVLLEGLLQGSSVVPEVGWFGFRFVVFFFDWILKFTVLKVGMRIRTPVFRGKDRADGRWGPTFGLLLFSVREGEEQGCFSVGMQFNSSSQGL